MDKSRKFYKNDPTDKIWWVDTSEQDGLMIFSFDKKQIFNLFAYYPEKLTSEQKEIFDAENPFWKDFFRNRTV